HVRQSSGRPDSPRYSPRRDRCKARLAGNVRSRAMAINKNDGHARAAWGSAYDAIPKSVFALAAWHLANVASDSADSDGAAERRFVEEVAALRDGQHLP